MVSEPEEVGCPRVNGAAQPSRPPVFVTHRPPRPAPHLALRADVDVAIAKIEAERPDLLMVHGTEDVSALNRRGAHTFNAPLG